MRPFLYLFAFLAGWLFSLLVEVETVLGPVYEWMQKSWLGPVVGL